MALVPPNKVQGGYPLGLTGATAATRYVGATTTGAPASGTFAVGDFVITQDGSIYICTVAGSPGTWTQVSGSGTTSDPIADTFGTPTTAFEFETSSLAGLTAVGTATAEDADTTIPSSYYVKKSANAGVLFTGRYVAVSPPFTVITKVTALSIKDQFNSVGLLVGAATPAGGIHYIAISCGSSWQSTFRATRWTDAVGGGGVEIGVIAATAALTEPVYLCQVAADSDDVDMYVSYNGYQWLPMFLNNNPAYTVGCVGLAVVPENAAYGAAGGFGFLRIWDSVKTVPTGV